MSNLGHFDSNIKPYISLLNPKATDYKPFFYVLKFPSLLNFPLMN